jgi:hypothetical protein
MNFPHMSLALSLAVLLGSNIAAAQIDVGKSVLTQRNDHWRRGAYLAETKLTPSSVKSSFGHLYTLPVTGPVLAQPLFAKGINIRGKQRNVLYVATRRNTIHAFDVGDHIRPEAKHLLWTRELPEVLPAPGNQPVTALWRDQDHLDLFMTGSDGRVLSNFWENNHGWWHEWFPIRPDTAVGIAGVPQQITALWGDPSDPRHLSLFMVDRDGTVKSIFCSVQPDRPCWKNEAWFSIGLHGIATPGQPVTAVWRDIGTFTHLDLFIVGKDGKVLSNFWEERDSKWHDWFPIRPDTATARPGKPQKVSALWGDPNNAQHLNLFMVDREGTVKTISCTLQRNRPCWQKEAWSSIGSSIATPGQPVTALWRDDGTFSHLDLFIVARTGRITSTFWENDDAGWRQWFSIRPDTLGAVAKPQEITAVWGDPNEKQHLNLFMVDRSGQVKSIFCRVRPDRPCWQDEIENWFSISPSSAMVSPGQPVSAVWRDSQFKHLDLFTAGEQLSGTKIDPAKVELGPPDPITGKMTAVPKQMGMQSGIVGPIVIGEGIVSRPGTIVSNFWEDEGGWGPWFPVPLRAEALPGMDDKIEILHPDHFKNCLQTHGQVGIVSTPAIDHLTNTMYVVYRTGFPLDTELEHHNNAAHYRFDSHHWLAAIDIATGSDTRPPVEIVAENFDPTMQLNRPGLLLQDGVVIVAFGAAVCDSGGNPYQPAGGPHGWVFAYGMNDLRRLAVFTTASDGVEGDVVANANVLAGIWQSGTGLSSDANGHIYAFTGNNQGVIEGLRPDFSESILRLRLKPNNATNTHVFLVDHYRVPQADILDGAGNDGDLGAGAPILPFDDLLVGGGKQGGLYKIKNPEDARNWPPQDQDVHQFQAFFNTHVGPKESGAGIAIPRFPTCDSPIERKYAPQTAGPNLHGSPVVWRPDDVNFAFIYGMPEKDYVRAFEIDKVSMTFVHCHAKTTEKIAGGKIRSPDGMPGGFLSISANGGRDGILWASVAVQDKDATNTFGEVNGRLIAMNALTLEKLWEDTDEPNSTSVPFAKFVPPTIAGGLVFRTAYRDAVHVYGLKPLGPDAHRIPRHVANPYAGGRRGGRHLQLERRGLRSRICSIARDYLDPDSLAMCGPNR